MTGLYSWLMFPFILVLIDVAGESCSDSGVAIGYMGNV